MPAMIAVRGTCVRGTGYLTRKARVRVPRPRRHLASPVPADTDFNPSPRLSPARGEESRFSNYGQINLHRNYFINPARIRLTRSFDESSPAYLGYAIMLEGEMDGQHGSGDETDIYRNANFSVGIGKAAHAKHQLKVNDIISGDCLPVPDPDMEPVDYYKVSKLKVVSWGEQGSTSAPWEMIPPELDVYRERGHRRLAAITYDSKCSSCMWGARMPVEIIVDKWNPRGRRKYRFETFCYGPLNCKHYKAGPNRKVEGRNKVVYVEEDWVDAQMTAHREPDQ